VRSGKLLSSLAGHPGQILAVAFSPDGKKLASGCTGGMGIAWDVDNGKSLFRAGLGRHNIRRVAFSPDGKLQASCGTDRFIHLWDVGGGKERPPLQGHQSSVEGLVFFDKSKRLLSAGADGTVRVWDVASGEELRRFGGPQGYLRSLALSPNGKTVAGGSLNGLVVFWDFASGKELRRIDQGGPMAVASIRYSPDGTVLATSRFCMVQLWDTATWKLLTPGDAPASAPQVLAFSPDGKMLATSGDDYLRLWDVKTGKVVRRLKETNGRWSAVSFSPDGKLLAGADGYRATPCIWDTASGEEAFRLPRQPSWVSNLTFLKNGKRPAFGCFPEVVIYDITTRQERLRFKDHNRQFGLLVGSPYLPSLAWTDRAGGVTCGTRFQIPLRWRSRVIRSARTRLPSPDGRRSARTRLPSLRTAGHWQP
jgi:WD40 repeat protein